MTSPASSGAFSALLREQRYRRHFLVSDTKLTAVVMTVLGWAVVATVVNDVRLLRDRWTFWPVVLTKVGVAVYTSAMGLRLRRARWPRQADRILAWIFAVFVLAYCAIFPTRWGPAEVQGPIIGSSAISAIVYFALRGPVRPRAWVGSSIILVAIPLLWNPAAVVSPAARVTGTVAMVVVNVLGILGAYNAEQQRRRLFAAERHERLARQKLQENLRALAAAKERAEQSSRARTAFLAAMSHEFRTPMNAVINLSELLLDRGENEPLGEEGREHLRIVHDSARALLSQLNEILDFDQIDAQKLTLVPAPFHLPRLLASVTGMLRPAARARGLTLSLEAAPDLPVHVEADEARLRQVLVNLVSNAIKFTSKGSVRIQVRSQPVDDQRFDVSFAVKDTGIGLTKEAMSKLFRPFERIETGEKRAPGTGLGLAISQQIVGAMGGRIEVESEPSSGSTFFFTIRLAEKEALPFSIRRAPVASQPSGSLTILVVDDHEINRLVAKAALARLGHTAHTVESGEEAIRETERQGYDVIFMDLQMSGLDGLETTRRILAKAPREKRPIIVAMSASVFEEDRAACLRAGMRDFVDKPIDLDQLEALLERLRGERASLAP